MAGAGSPPLQKLPAGSRNALLLGVGGGNDAVSSLMLKAQLAADLGFRPGRFDLAAMLPDVLAYADAEPTAHRLAMRITPRTHRLLWGRPLASFPEPLLAVHAERFGFGAVYGILMTEGTAGVAEALSALAAAGGYDLILAADVGGDFIAAPENLAVLSPMMDGHALWALRRLTGAAAGGGAAGSAFPPVVFAVFGLGTDAESTPEMLRLALSRLRGTLTGTMTGPAIAEAADLYRAAIRPNRRSNTADRLIDVVEGLGPADGLVRHRVTFHVNVSATRLETHAVQFEHRMDADLAARYVVFDDASAVGNPFSIGCRDSLEWFVRARRLGRHLNHELNGYGWPATPAAATADGPAPPHVFFGTPSDRFAEATRRRIADDVAESVRAGIHPAALLDDRDAAAADFDGLAVTPLPTGLLLIAGPRHSGWAASLGERIAGIAG